MHGKLKDIVTGLSGGDISGIKVGANLIMTLCEDNSMIRTLVDVLVDILDSLDRATDF